MRETHLSTLQILVVGLWRVAHGFNRLVVDVKAERDTLVVYRLRLPGTVHIHSLLALHVSIFMVDYSLEIGRKNRV